MRLYKCLDCGGLFQTEEMRWTDHSYDMKRLDGLVFPVCPSCGSEDIDWGEECEYCENDVATDTLGAYEVCDKCRELILTSISKSVNEYADKQGIEYRTAKEWFLGWADNNF